MRGESTRSTRWAPDRALHTAEGQVPLRRLPAELGFGAGEAYPGDLACVIARCAARWPRGSCGSGLGGQREKGASRSARIAAAS